MSSQKFGSEDKPLIIAMRSAMPSYIPGLMPTFLNVGVTRQNFPVLCTILGKTVSKKIYLSNLRTLELSLFGGYETEQNIEVEHIDEEIEYHYNRISIQDERLLHDAFYQVCFSWGEHTNTSKIIRIYFTHSYAKEKNFHRLSCKKWCGQYVVTNPTREFYTADMPEQVWVFKW